MTIQTADIKRAICSLFEVYPDEKGVQRIVTPLEYDGSGDQIVVRVRPRGESFSVDENGEASFLAAMNGGNLDTEQFNRWAESLREFSPVSLDEDGVLSADVTDVGLLAPYILKVAQSAQQLYTLATARVERQQNNFKERVATIVREIVEQTAVAWEENVPLPIIGDMMADHVLGPSTNPLIIIAATSATRLLEAEIIHFQYRKENKPGYVLAIVESQTAVTQKQFERAAYFTDKTVAMEPRNLTSLLKNEADSRRLPN